MVCPLDSNTPPLGLPKGPDTHTDTHSDPPAGTSGTQASINKSFIAPAPGAGPVCVAMLEFCFGIQKELP